MTKMLVAGSSSLQQKWWLAWLPAFALLSLGASTIGLAQEASLSIESPSPGSTVAGSEFTVKLQVQGAVLGERSRNGAQVLLYLDRYPPVKSYSESFTFRGVDAGEHRLVAELRHADGTPFEPAVRASVSFKVEPADRHASRLER